MKRVEIEINDKVYKAKIAFTDEERQKGLQNIPHLPKNEGMVFSFEEPQEVGFWMKDTHIPLDIIFIDEDWEVIRVTQGEPLSEALIEQDDVSYVLELNVESGVSIGDYVDLFEVDEACEELCKEENEDEDEDKEVSVMVVLNLEGESQMELSGGERIFSRKNTKTLISMAKRADKSKKDSDYKRLGTKVFSYLKTQDTKEEEFVEIPQKKKA